MRCSLWAAERIFPSYYRRSGGYVDNYLYVAAKQRFYDDVRRAFSAPEIVTKAFSSSSEPEWR